MIIGEHRLPVKDGVKGCEVMPASGLHREELTNSQSPEQQIRA